MSDSKFSDIDVFKGVIFLEGSVADAIPEYKDLNIRNFIKDPTKISAVLDFQNKLIEKIQEDNPNYLAEFRKSISSGDYYEVKEVIENTGQLIKETILKMYNLSDLPDEEIRNIAKNYMEKNGIKPEQKGTSTKQLMRAATQTESAGSTLWFDTDTVVYVAVAAVAIVGAIAVFLGTEKEISPSLEESTSYISDKFITDITMRLKTQ